jgi:hypothetical protein
VWIFIRMEWGEFTQFVRFKAGDGSKIKFWQDVWCGDQSLKSVFPELFSITHWKKASIVDLLQIHNSNSQQNITFI